MHNGWEPFIFVSGGATPFITKRCNPNDVVVGNTDQHDKCVR